MNKILIVEQNPYHNEVIPGIVLYMEKLGYCVEVVIRKECEKDGVFCRCRGRFRVMVMDILEIKDYLKSSEMKNYDFLFLSSMEFTDSGKIDRFLNWLGFEPDTKYGTLGIYHTISYIKKFEDFEMLQQGRLFCLSQFQTRDYPVKTLNCHYFGKIQNKEECGTKIRAITVIGVAAEKDYLMKTLSQIPEEIRKRLRIDLVGEKKRPIWVKTRRRIKIVLFSILAVFNKAYSVKKKSAQRILEEGYVSFPKMYKMIENSDFILVMINPENPDHYRYMNLATSGVLQLIYGFNKVCLIRREVAEIYGFSNENAILYEKGELKEALKEAVGMERRSYMMKQQLVAEREQQIFNDSLDNLRRTINQIKSMEDVCKSLGQ